jgi:hypothetical protein
VLYILVVWHIRGPWRRGQNKISIKYTLWVSITVFISLDNNDMSSVRRHPRTKEDVKVSWESHKPCFTLSPWRAKRRHRNRKTSK